MSEQLTIIIITYNRYQFLLRLLKFFYSYTQKFQILILDSSSDAIESQELKEYFTQENITHKKFDPSIFFVDKIARGCKLIKTEYSVLCADDDFIIPTALEDCLKFLKNSEDYSSAHGLYFNHSGGNVKKSSFSIGSLNTVVRSSAEKTSAERLSLYLDGQTGSYPMYAVHPTGLFQRIWGEANNYVSDWGLSELFPCALSFIYGKMKVLPIFYASREPNNCSWYDEERHKEMYSDKKLKKAVEGLCVHLSIVDKISLEDARSVVVDSFNLYLNRVFSKNLSLQKNSFQKTWSFLREKIGIRTRLRILFLDGCHPSIYPDYLEDYTKIKHLVTTCSIPIEHLNKIRRQYTEHGLS